MHDPKAAVALARLHVVRPGKLFAEKPDEQRDKRALVERRTLVSGFLASCYGQLEALLARHWPEIAGHVDVYAQRSWMALMQAFPGPEAVSLDPTGAGQVLPLGPVRVAHLLSIVVSPHGFRTRRQLWEYVRSARSADHIRCVRGLTDVESSNINVQQTLTRSSGGVV